MATVHWPSDIVGTPTSVGDDGSGVMTLGVQFYCPNSFTCVGARFYATGAVVGEHGFATLIKRTGTGESATSAVAASSTVTLVEGWNDMLFSSSLETVADTLGYYMVVEIDHRAYTYTSGVMVNTNAAATGTTHCRIVSGIDGGVYSYSAMDSAASAWQLNTNHTQSWYGVDVLDSPSGGSTASDALTLSDGVTITRTGLPTSVTATATASDSTATTTASVTASVSTGTGLRKVKRYLHRDRLFAQSIVDPVLRSGPGTVISTPQTLGTELGLTFQIVDIPTRFTGFRLWKAPVASGTVPVTLWDYDTKVALATMNLTWVSDAGGWEEHDFPTPVSLAPNKKYVISYNANAWAATQWLFNGQDYIEPPFFVQPGVSGAASEGAGIFLNDAHGFPETRNSAAWYWCDPRIEWDDPLPGYEGGIDYYGQWPDCAWPHEFVFTVFSIDGGYLQQYKDWGLNVVMPTNALVQRDEVVAVGLPWIGLGEDGAYSAKLLSLDPTLRALHLAYYLQDEPDMFGSYTSPTDMLARRNALKAVDSGKPTMVGWGIPVLDAQRFDWSPQGATPEKVNADWRSTTDLVDMLSGDDYKLILNSPEYGPWNYGRQVQRLKNLGNDRLPVTIAIETCILPVGVRQPLPEELVAAAWQALIHGAVGVIWFDHQFPMSTSDGSSYPQDFQAILNSTDGRKTAVSALMTFVKSLGLAAINPEANLLTAKDTSNKTAGPIGTELGVPLDTKTTQAGGYSYLFAQAARPGTTTGTFTVPSAASKTLTVLNESRTVTANSSGVFTDTFTGYYTTHVYRWS